MAGKRTLIVPKSRRPELVEETRIDAKPPVEDLPRVISRIGRVDEIDVSTFRSERQRNSEAVNAETEEPIASSAPEAESRQSTAAIQSSAAKSETDSTSSKAKDPTRSTLGRVKHHFTALRAELASSKSRAERNKDERQSTYHRIAAAGVASILVLVTVGIVWQMKYRAGRRSNSETVAASKVVTPEIANPAPKKLAASKTKPGAKSGSANLSKVTVTKSETSVKTGSPPKIYGENVFIPSPDQAQHTVLPPLPMNLQAGNAQSNFAAQNGMQNPGQNGAGFSNGQIAAQPSPQFSPNVAMQPRMPNQMPIMRNENPNVIQQTNPYASPNAQFAVQPPSQNVPAGAMLPIPPNGNGYGLQPPANQYPNNNGLFQQGSPVSIAQQPNVRSNPAANSSQGGPVTYAPNGDVRLDGGIESIPIRR